MSEIQEQLEDLKKLLADLEKSGGSFNPAP